jgi:hypothetical protein
MIASMHAPPNGHLIGADLRGAPHRRPNVIILTSGITGSSVLSGFLTRPGYWAGDTTHKKDYDTFESAELIRLNLRIFQQAGYAGNYLKEFSTDAVARIASIKDTSNCSPYREFLRKCAEHRPWVWKDPRLWPTIYFWANLLDLDECGFILLTRDLVQAWVSCTLRRDIRSYDSFRLYETSVKNSILSFLTGNRLPYLQRESYCPTGKNHNGFEQAFSSGPHRK